MKWLSCWFFADIRSFTSVLAVSSASVALDGIATSSLLSYLSMQTFVSLGRRQLCAFAIQNLNRRAQSKMHHLLSSAAFARIICLLATFSLRTALIVWSGLHLTSVFFFFLLKSAFKNKHIQPKYVKARKQEITLILFFNICYFFFY